MSRVSSACGFPDIVIFHNFFCLRKIEVRTVNVGRNGEERPVSQQMACLGDAARCFPVPYLQTNIEFLHRSVIRRRALLQSGDPGGRD